ncbi:MAG: UDP-2,3-diacylglucosamine diphosphatase [Campylobacterota bacterium]|nr:UDP-2,3-diacylglucosamine diphosphatase [Campylobacterota bacterium]
MKYKSIFISDVHLGTKFSQAEQLLEFLKDNESENLFLVGDIIDGWAIKRKFIWEQSHSDVIQKILRKARKGTNVQFILGNHDEFLRPFAPLVLGDSLEIKKDVEYLALNGKKYLVTHGDFFDMITMTKKWLSVLGDVGYSFLLNINLLLNKLYKLFGLRKYWSLSKYIKDNVKKSVSFITDYEEILVQHAKTNNYDGVICGHIHKAQMRQIDGIDYFNCGDWVESCTVVIENFDGTWEILDCMSKEDTV